MHAILKRIRVVWVVAIIGFSLTFAVTLETNASESSTTDGHVNAQTTTGLIELDPSLGARCKRVTPRESIYYEKCASAEHIVSLMKAERRDRLWADRMESNLSNWIGSLASDGFTLGSISCRLSWCAVDVRSTQARGLIMNPSDAYKWKLFDDLDLFAPNIDDPSAQDQLIFYKRYCNSVNEILNPDSHVVRNFATVGQNC